MLVQEHITQTLIQTIGLDKILRNTFLSQYFINFHLHLKNKTRILILIATFDVIYFSDDFRINNSDLLNK